MSERRAVRRAALLGLAAVFVVAWRSGAEEPATEVLTLGRATELALARAPLLAASHAAWEESAAGERLAKDVFHPELSVGASPGYARGLPVGQLPSIAEAALRQSLYDPERRAAAFEAEARSATSRAAHGSQRRATVRAVADAYARCWTDERLVAAAKRRREAYHALALRAEALRHEGRITDLEQEQARLRETRARQAALDAQSDHDLDQLELRQLTGWPAHLPLRLSPEPRDELGAPSPTDNFEAARAADPERHGLQEAIAALDQAARLRERPVGPVVEAGARYARLYRTTDYDEFYRSFRADEWSVGITVTVPLWTGGRRADAAARSRAARDRVELQLRAREADLELLVRRVEAAVQRAQARASLGRRAEGLAQEELRVARALRAEGRESEVEEKEAALAEAEAEAARAEAEALRARVELLTLRGESATS